MRPEALKLSVYEALMKPSGDERGRASQGTTYICICNVSMYLCIGDEEEMLVATKMKAHQCATAQ